MLTEVTKVQLNYVSSIWLICMLHLKRFYSRRFFENRNKNYTCFKTITLFRQLLNSIRLFQNYSQLHLT